MSFFCKACARMPIELINKAIKETKKELLSETVGVTECYKKKGVDFCFQCDEFPCEKTNFDPHLKARWIKMNNRMKEIGVESYYEETKDLCRYL